MNDDLPAKIGRDALAVEQARLASSFQTINKHRKALAAPSRRIPWR